MHRLEFRNDNCADILELEFDSKLPNNKNTSYEILAGIGLFKMLKFVIASDNISIIVNNDHQQFVANLSQEMISHPDEIDQYNNYYYRIYWKQTLYQGILIIGGKQWIFQISTAVPNALQLNFGSRFGQIIFNNNCAYFKDIRLKQSISRQREIFIAMIDQQASTLQMQNQNTSMNTKPKKSRCLSCNCNMM